MRTLTRELVLDRYALLEHLGSGGFGSVWLAHDEHLQREVALKRIPRGSGSGSGSGDSREAARRVSREALAAARLAHPAIVALYEATADEEAFYLVSELVHGPSLAELFAQGGMGDEALLSIGIVLCEALAHAHSRGVVHRDVKPQNVILPSEEEGVPAKLTDFGVAWIAGEQPLTRTGDVIGTLAYMAPEQADGRHAGPPADLYSLALVLYEGLAGSNPVRGATPAQTARRMGSRLPPLSRARPDLPRSLCDAIDVALLADPTRRGSLADLREALLAGGQELPPVLAPPRTNRRSPLLAPLGAPRRARLLCAAAAGLLSLGFLLGGFGPPHASAQIGPVCLAAILGCGLAPRLGWLALAAGAVLWLAFAGQPGTALLVLLALSAMPLLLPSAPWLWSAPALAPLLGLAGVALAFCALAGHVSGAWRRAALGIGGVLWLSVAELMSGQRLLLGVPHAALPRASWQASLPDAVSHALLPLLSSGALALAGAWAIAAAMMPLLVRGTGSYGRALAAILWATALAAGCGALWGALSASLVPVESTALVLGAAACAGLAWPRMPTVVA